MTIQIEVRNKALSVIGEPEIICGNSGYEIQFSFDAEWEKYPVKTARFLYNKHYEWQYEDVVFEGNTVSVPDVYDIEELLVGVYAGDICATTPGEIKCRRSILCSNPIHIVPPADVYNQIMAQLSSRNTDSYDQNVKAVNHRGYNVGAPENTIPAFILSKKKGFHYVECDVAFTSDGIPVLNHDDTIDRTSDGTGNVYEKTYAELYQYDFGSWKSPEYAGTKIATFEEFLVLCKNIGLHPYIELKTSGKYTKEQIGSLVNMVEEHGMKGKVTWISFSSAYLAYVCEFDKNARVGFLRSAVSPDAISAAAGLKTADNEVFLDCGYGSATEENIKLCIEAGLPLEVYTPNTEAAIKNLHPYITGVTSDKLIAGKVLRNESMNYVVPELDLSATSITLSASEIYFTSKDSSTITATVIPAGCPDPVVWTSSNESVATVENGIVTPVGNGSAIIKATVGSLFAECSVSVKLETRTLLYNWDFTKSLTDTVNGTTGTIIGNATQDANGITITDASSGVDFGQIANTGTTIEIDLAPDSTITKTTSNGRLLCFAYGTGEANQHGIVWRATGKEWNAYFGAWQTAYSNDVNFFSGKTLSACIHSDRTVSLYSDGVHLITTTGTVNFNNRGYLAIGSVGSAAAGMVITGMRIYDGVIVPADSVEAITINVGPESDYSNQEPVDLDEGNYAYKVSDAAPTLEQIQNCRISCGANEIIFEFATPQVVYDAYFGGYTVSFTTRTTDTESITVDLLNNLFVSDGSKYAAGVYMAYDWMEGSISEFFEADWRAFSLDYATIYFPEV